MSHVVHACTALKYAHGNISLMAIRRGAMFNKNTVWWCVYARVHSTLQSHLSIELSFSFLFIEVFTSNFQLYRYTVCCNFHANLL